MYPCVIVFYVRSTKSKQPISHPSDNTWSSCINAFVEREINHMLIGDRIIQSTPDFEMLLKEYYEGILLFDIMEKEVWKKRVTIHLVSENYFHTMLAKYAAGESAMQRFMH
jgi:peptidyl-prolyl cis-trans isomerase SurA